MGQEQKCVVISRFFCLVIEWQDQEERRIGLFTLLFQQLWFYNWNTFVGLWPIPLLRSMRS